jgi:hypothetical protein
MPYSVPQGAFTQDAINALLANPLDANHQIAVNGAIDPTTPGRYVITKAGVAALTLAAPVAGRDDGLEIYLGSTTANAHTITCPAGTFQAGVANNTVATFPAQPGAGLFLMAFNGKWIVTGIVGAVAFT